MRIALLVAALLAATSVLVLVATRGARTNRSFTTAPAAYVVLYRNEINGVAQWEVLAVRRPFDGSDLTYRTETPPGPHARADSGTISTRTALYTENASGVHAVSGRQPGPPSADLWLSVEMPDALARNLARDEHRVRVIAGRRCAVYRVADPPSGPLHLLDPAVGHDDLCLTRDGLVLAETWTYHGSVVEQRTAVAVFVGGTWPPALPQPGSTSNATPAPAAGAVVRPDPRPTTVIATPPAPTGFRLAGDPLSFRLPDPVHPALAVASTVVWAFVDGPIVVTVEAGTERGGQLPWDPADSATRPLHLASLGEATTALRSDGPEVRVDLGQGGWVRVRGTVTLPFLTAYAARLRRG